MTFVVLFLYLVYLETKFFVFIVEEILESIRAKKGDIDIVKSPEEIEKDKNETENNNSKDAEKSREEFEDQSLEKDGDDKAPDDDPEQGKSEGKKITWLENSISSVLFMKPPILLSK